MAFLHQVVNGDGTLEREYAIGSGRMDLCLPLRRADSGCLAIFDHRSGQPPMAQRTSRVETVSPQGRRIIVVRG